MVHNVKYGKVFAAAVVIGLLIMGAVYVLMPVRTWDFEVVPVHSQRNGDARTYILSASGSDNKLAYTYVEHGTYNTTLVLYDIALKQKTTLHTFQQWTSISDISMSGGRIVFYMDNTTGRYCMLYNIPTYELVQVSLDEQLTTNFAHPDIDGDRVVYTHWNSDESRYEMDLVNLATGDRRTLVTPFDYHIYGGTISGDRIVYDTGTSAFNYYTISTDTYTKVDGWVGQSLDHDGDIAVLYRTYYALPNQLYVTNIATNTTKQIANNMGWGEPYQITRDRIVFTSNDPFFGDEGMIYLYDVNRDLTLPLTDASFSNKVEGASFQEPRDHASFGSYTAVVVSNTNYSQGYELWLMKFVFHESTAISSVFGGQAGGLTIPQVSLVVILITGAAIMTIYFTMKGEEDKIKTRHDRGQYNQDRRRRW